jgi:large repetitive protein
LPPGVTIDKAQTLQGTPSLPGKYAFTIQASDAKTPTLTASQSFSLTIQNNLVFTGSNLPPGIVNFAYAQPVPVAGGTLPYHFSILPQSVLPAGLSLDGNSGLISGIPSATGYSTFWVQVTDSSPQPVTISEYLTLSISLPVSITPTTLPDSARGFSYSANLAVLNGVSPYSTTVTSGALPDGLSLSGLNVIGSPTKDGLFKFTVKVSDAYSPPSTATQDYQIRISEPMTLTGPAQVIILYNQSYSAAFPAAGGFPPYAWGMNPVPPGFTFDPTTGTLSGTPNGVGVTNTNVTVHDSSNPPLTATFYNFSLYVTPKLAIYTTSLPTVATASTVLVQPIVMGGAANYQWSVSPGSLPPGMTLNTFSNGNGYISGSPTTAGVYPFTLNISDGNTGNLHQTVSQPLTWTVKDRGQMTRNDTIGTATPLSNIGLLASISPFTDPSSSGPDVDVYSANAPPGSIVQVYAAPNNDFLQPPQPNSLQPVLEIVDSIGVRYQTCGGSSLNLPCINHLPGTNYIQGNYYSFQVPGTGTAPVTFFIRVSDARGDARPDFIYTLNVFGVN